METKYAVERDLILKKEGSSYLNIDGYDAYKKIPLDFKYGLEIFKKNNSDKFLALFIDNEEDSPLSIDEVFNLFKDKYSEVIIDPYKKIINNSNFKTVRIGFVDVNCITLNTKELNILVNHFVKWSFEEDGISTDLIYNHRNTRMVDDIRIKKIDENIEIRMTGLSRIKNTYEIVSFVGLFQSEGLKILNKIRVGYVHGNIESKINYNLEGIFQLKNIDRDYVEAFYRMLLHDLKEKKDKGYDSIEKYDNLWNFVKYGDINAKSHEDKINQEDTQQQLQNKLKEMEKQLSYKNNTIKQLKQHNKKIKSEYESKIKSLEQSISDLKRNKQKNKK